jgi:hypothetical protein
VKLAFYADAAYIIAGFSDRDKPEVKAFEIIDGKVREIGIALKD